MSYIDLLVAGRQKIRIRPRYSIC